MTAKLRWRRSADPIAPPHARVHTKSLLASLAMMAYLDPTSDKRVLLCDEDGRPFVSGAYQAPPLLGPLPQSRPQAAYRERHRDDDESQRTSA